MVGLVQVDTAPYVVDRNKTLQLTGVRVQQKACLPVSAQIAWNSWALFGVLVAVLKVNIERPVTQTLYSFLRTDVAIEVNNALYINGTATGLAVENTAAGADGRRDSTGRCGHDGTDETSCGSEELQFE